MNPIHKPLAGLTLAAILALGACNSLPQSELVSEVATAAGPTCYTFDDLTVGDAFYDDETYAARKADIHFHEYLFNGGTYYKGAVLITNSGIVNNTPPSVSLRSLVSEFVPDTPAQTITFLYSEVLQGVHANFDINGSGVQEYASLGALDGQNLGGVDITVSVNVSGGKQTGMVTLTANPTPISSVKFGGRTLVIDDFCHE